MIRELCTYVRRTVVQTPCSSLCGEVCSLSLMAANPLRRRPRTFMGSCRWAVRCCEHATLLLMDVEGKGPARSGDGSEGSVGERITMAATRLRARARSCRWADDSHERRRGGERRRLLRIVSNGIPPFIPIRPRTDHEQDPRTA